ncbi:tyrosine-type recombinase/integrase [Novosphingobium panipatense]|uniref:Site-specific recombinase XerD n=1 Tax=Novosphingobium panipatense TaxID=428991 RepID=A0ABY1Q6W0_9SPHN|nr:site-specific integrase [Novosphingobium panipatense]SMP58303.1 Site-specific recombinase XerD [Novosphingobium panipatense]
MAIYADKRNGKLTGRFRVELQKGAERYRKRHDSMAEAEADEKRVLAAWEAGEDPKEEPKAPEVAVEGVTLSKAIQLAEGILWRGIASEAGNWQHIRFVERTLGGNISLDAIDTEAVRKVLKAADDKGIADGTLNRYISHIRTFLEWHFQEGNRKESIAAIRWDWRKESKGRLRWLTFAEEDQLLSLLPPATAKLVRVAIDTGCRREELMGAKIDQVDQEGTDDGLFHIWKTKNNEARSVPISAETAKLLRELLSGEMPSKRSLRRHWDKAKATMGLASDGEFVFHTCRHTCATRMVDADVDILVIKEWLGHKRIETTQRYAKVRGKKLASILARVGGLRALEAGNSRKTGLPHTPPQVSPRGGMGQIDMAA